MLQLEGNQLKEDEQMSKVIRAMDSNSTSDHMLPRSRPEDNGIASSAITAFLVAASDERLGMHSFMLLRHGKVVSEAWWSPYGPERPHMMFSLSKSFTSTAIGLAVSEGLLTAEDRVVTFFPDKNISDDVNLNKMCVKHLLSMSTGHAVESMDQVMRGEKDWVQVILNQPVEYEPGTHFTYNSGATYMLSAIVQKLTGQTVHDYLTPRLFRPLGIEGTTWEQCPRGISTGGWGLTLKTEDIAKFGQLYLQKGVWQGTHLIDEAWIDEATTYQVSNASSNTNPDWQQGYGYQFWRCRYGAYRGDGAFGQYCIVMPEQDIVIAMTAGSKDMQGTLNLIWEHLLPAIAEGPLEADEQEYARLCEVSASLAYLPLQSGVVPSVAELVSGKMYTFKENNRGIQAAKMQIDEKEVLITAWSPIGEMQVRCGMGHWVEDITYNAPTTARYVASGKWESPDTFVMNWRFIETPFADTLTFHFAQERVSIRIETDVRFGSTEPDLLEGSMDER